MIWGAFCIGQGIHPCDPGIPSWPTGRHRYTPRPSAWARFIRPTSRSSWPEATWFWRHLVGHCPAVQDWLQHRLLRQTLPTSAGRLVHSCATRPQGSKGSRVLSRGGADASRSNSLRGCAAVVGGCRGSEPDASRRDSGVDRARWEGLRLARRGARHRGDEGRPDRSERLRGHLRSARPDGDARLDRHAHPPRRAFRSRRPARSTVRRS